MLTEHHYLFDNQVTRIYYVIKRVSYLINNQMRGDKMNMQSVAVINSRQYEITGRTEKALILGSGKQYACYWPVSGKLVCKHVISGKFQSKKVR